MVAGDCRVAESAERAFDRAMRSACDEAAEAGYYPTRFLEKLERIGAVPYAKELVRSGELEAGLKRLNEMKRLDLSIEHLVVDSRFRELFSEEERDAAQWRLDQVRG